MEVIYITIIKQFKNLKWYIAKMDNGTVIVTNDYCTDYPLKYKHNGHIVYDTPEIVPQYIKKSMYKYL